MRLAAWIALMALGTPALAAATGRIVGPDGAPVSGAEVCELVEDVATRCAPVDAHGGFRVENPVGSLLLVRASGFVPRSVDAAPLSVPVELQRAATLRVTVVDALTDRPLSEGRVMIDSPSGRRIGDFVPFNKAGVRISTLAPGLVFVRASADGYKPAGPLPVELVSGTERSLKVPMSRSDTTKQ